MSNYDKVRERIAKLYLSKKGSLRATDPRVIEDIWRSETVDVRNACLYFADRILTDPDILIKAEDQVLPPLPQNIHDNPRMIQAKAMNEMLKAGWVKTEPKL